MKLRNLILAATAATALVPSADAAFHLMQIEQIIGGVNGNTSAQAITLRMRFAGQNVLGGMRLLAWDAAGLNPVVLFDFTTTFSGPGINTGTGARILLTSPAFDLGMASVPTFDSDFTLSNPIPAAYLNGGRVTFSTDAGTTHYWSLAFGAYTGSTAGTADNDADGNFGPAFPSALPTSGRQGIRFTGAAGDPSTTNLANYALTPNPATVTNNANVAFTVVPEPGSLALVAVGALALGGSVFSRRRNRGQR